MSEYPEWGTEDYRRYATLFNDITHSPVQRFIHLSDRQKIANHLWSQGWRREVRDEDVTELREKGRRLASEREDLIAQGVDPADLLIPHAPDLTGKWDDDAKFSYQGEVFSPTFTKGMRIMMPSGQVLVVISVEGGRIRCAVPDDVNEMPDPLPIHRTEAGYPNCSTCDGGGCPDCTDPS